MRAALLGVAILALLIGTPIVARRTADDPPDTRQPGPYAVGLTTQRFSRVQPDGQTRTVETWIWYPAPKPAGMPTALAVAAKVDAEVAPGGPFPVIIFSHGSGATSSLYSKLLTHLVTHGFVVAGPNHQDCTTCPDPTRGGATANRPADVSMVLDRLVEANAGGDPLFRGLVDPQHVGVAGHSFGGWTTMMVLEQDARFKAGLGLSPGTMASPPMRPSTVTRPVMLFSGVLDAMTSYAMIGRFFTDIPASAPDHYLLVAPRVGHQFHNLCGSGFVTTGCNDTLPQPQVQAMMDRIGTAFLLRYVAERRITDRQLGLQDDDPEYTVLKATSAGAPPLPTPAPIRSAAAAASPPGTVLWKSGQGDGLSASADPSAYEVTEANDGYEIEVRQALVFGHAVVPGDYADATVAVDITATDPTPAQQVQLACRAQSPGAQYRFGFRPATGEVILNRWMRLPGIGSPFRPLLPAGQFSSAIRQGKATNHVELTCRGTTITARINGERVLSVPDNTFAAGRIMIGTSLVSDEPVPSAWARAQFRNLVVLQE